MENFDDTMNLNEKKVDKQLIENIELRNFVQAKLNKNDVTQKDLNEVFEIILDSENIIGNYNKVYFQEIELFPNLKKIEIKNLGIIAEEMNKLNRIKHISFTNCQINDISKISEVQSLTLVNSEVENLEKVNLLEKIKELELINMQIDDFNFLKSFSQLEKLVIKNVEQFSLDKINFPLPIEYLSVEKIEKLNLGVIYKYENLKTVSVDREEAEEWKEELQLLKDKGIKILLNDIYEY